MLIYLNKRPNPPLGTIPHLISSARRFENGRTCVAAAQSGVRHRVLNVVYGGDTCSG